MTPTQAVTTTPPLSDSNWIVVGAPAGQLPNVEVIDTTTGDTVQSLLAYNKAFRGGVDVALGDINGDGTDDIITGAGVTGGPHIRVFDGVTGNRIGNFFAFDSSSRRGVSVAAGDVTGDGIADIIVGEGPGAHSEVKVFDGTDFSLVHTFTAYRRDFLGGVDVAAGDVNGDGYADIITGARAGGGPHVKVFDGRSHETIDSFFAYEHSNRSGVNLAASDTNGDGFADVIVGSGAGRKSEVRVFDSASQTLRVSRRPFGNSDTSGIRVAAVNANNDANADVVVSRGSAQPSVQTLDGVSLDPLDDFFSFDGIFRGGAFVD